VPWQTTPGAWYHGLRRRSTVSIALLWLFRMSMYVSLLMSLFVSLSLILSLFSFSSSPVHGSPACLKIGSH